MNGATPLGTGAMNGPAPPKCDFDLTSSPDTSFLPAADGLPRRVRAVCEASPAHLTMSGPYVMQVPHAHKHKAATM